MTIHQTIEPAASLTARDVQDAYIEFLHMELRLACIEANRVMDGRENIPANTFAQRFHFPSEGSWRDVPKPSTRALAVMTAAGVVIPTS